MAGEAKSGVLVGRKVGVHEPRVWLLRGVFTGTDAKKKAEDICTDEWFFCCKIELNKDLDLQDIPWHNAWQPVKVKD